MLANGTKLGYSKTAPSGSSTSYTDLPGLKEIPDVGTDPEKVDNTVLTDKHKVYEKGIGDLPEMTYKFKYDNTKADSPYLKNIKDKSARITYIDQDGTVLYFRETDPDKTTLDFGATVSVKRTGGGVNGVIEFEVTMTVQTDITYTDPA